MSSVAALPLQGLPAPFDVVVPTDVVPSSSGVPPFSSSWCLGDGEGWSGPGHGQQGLHQLAAASGA